MCNIHIARTKRESFLMSRQTKVEVIEMKWKLFVEAEVARLLRVDCEEESIKHNARPGHWAVSANVARHLC